MRQVLGFNENWKFSKEDIQADEINGKEFESITIPHTWNALDGQDGGGDYFRGVTTYVKEFAKPDVPDGSVVYLEFKGVNDTATVIINGVEVAHHEGGYSAFRANITEHLKDINVLVVKVSNAPNSKIYPQRADFTFYGGIYRNVNLIIANKAHFDLDFFASKGFKVDTKVEKEEGIAVITGYPVGSDDVRVRIEDDKGNKVVEGKAGEELRIPNVHLWDGLKDPYCYVAYATLYVNGEPVDEVSDRIGFRSFSIDVKTGFYLNGKNYPLRGVSRHQDRLGIGNALTTKEHDEDMAIIKEMGANTIRLAHYQHDDYFYDLCDINGMVTWSEIPYISEHKDEADENCMQQMKELVYQTYNHPSIFFRCLSNEITMKKAGKDRLEQHKRLNAFVHEADPSRMTVDAGFAAIGDNNPLNFVPDVFSFNFYFGWYVPGTLLNNIRFGWFRFLHPKRPFGLSEYGAEGMPNLHSEHPKRFDNTEEYQAILHEKMLKIFAKRPYLWATHVWNMFDFGADARNQGGDPGKNHKGLVTFDRKIKKDAFYIYKAYLSKDPFVHLCSQRFINRTGSKTLIKAYSNQGKVDFYLNDKLFKSVTGDKIFKVTMPLTDGMKVKVVSNDMSEEMVIRKVAQMDQDYVLKKGGNSYSWEKKKAGADEANKRK